MLVGELGEFPLIARLQQVVQTGQSAHIVRGMGDDCAVVRATSAVDLLLTTDTQEEDVHFRRAWATPQDIGWRCLAVNVSDIAAMGGTPLGAVVALSVPATLEVAFVEQLYEGLQAVATTYALSYPRGQYQQKHRWIVCDHYGSWRSPPGTKRVS